VNDLSVLLFRVLGGYFTLLIITSVEAAVIFAFAGIPGLSIILGLLTGVIDFLPVLGASVVMLPVAVYCLANGNLVGAIVIVVGLAIMTVIRRVIEPSILGKSMQMHPLITLISMAAGVAVWGLAGFLLGPALAIIIAQIIKVFGIDKKVTEYVSNVLERLMKEPEAKGKES
nr:AI-2E family transporter [Saccharofermentans sp.]